MTKREVKVFRIGQGTPSKIEKEVNDWLSKAKGCKIDHIKTSRDGNLLILMIFYTKRLA
jgi:hypothetical protein